MYFEVYVRAGHVLDFMKAVPLTVRLVNGIFRYFEQLSFYKDHNIINGVNCRYFRSHGSSHYRLFHVQKQKTCKKISKCKQFNNSLNKQGKNRKQHSYNLKFLQVSCKLKQKRGHRLPLICNTFVSFLFSTFNFLVFKRPFPFLNDLKIIFSESTFLRCEWFPGLQLNFFELS